MLEESSEVVVVEEDQDEGEGGEEGDEDEGVEERTLELVGSGVGWALEVDEVDGGARGRGLCSRGEDGDEDDDKEHADGDRGYDADDFDPD